MSISTYCNLIQYFQPLPRQLGLHFHRWTDRKIEQKDRGSSAWFLYYLIFWSCNKKFFCFQVLYSWIHKSIFFLETAGCFKYFKGLYFCILSSTTENYPTYLTLYQLTPKGELWLKFGRVVQIWKGHHITDQEKNKTVVSLLDFWAPMWQKFKFRLACMEALF